MHWIKVFRRIESIFNIFLLGNTIRKVFTRNYSWNCKSIAEILKKACLAIVALFFKSKVLFPLDALLFCLAGLMIFFGLANYVSVCRNWLLYDSNHWLLYLSPLAIFVRSIISLKSLQNRYIFTWNIILFVCLWIPGIRITGCIVTSEYQKARSIIFCWRFAAFKWKE